MKKDSILTQFDNEQHRLLGQYIDDQIDCVVSKKVENAFIHQDYDEIMDIAEQENIIRDCLNYDDFENPNDIDHQDIHNQDI